MSNPPPYAPTDSKIGGPPEGYPPQPQPGYPQQPPPGYPQQPQPGYPQQPQPGYAQQPAPPMVTVVQQPIVTTTVVQQFRESPVQTVCPYCSANIITAIHYDIGTFTWLIGGVICLVGCWLGCCLIPCCIDGCKDAVHTCPNCHHQIGRWSRL